jgi:hypothetical protein
LQSVRDEGRREPWLAFFLRGVVAVSDQAMDTARRVLTLREEHRSAITARLGRAAGNGHRVLEHLYDHPIVSVNDVRQLIGTTYPAANQLVQRMVEAGIRPDTPHLSDNLARCRGAPELDVSGSGQTGSVRGACGRPVFTGSLYCFGEAARIAETRD